MVSGFVVTNWGGWYPSENSFIGVCPRCLQPFRVYEGPWFSVTPPPITCGCSSSGVISNGTNYRFTDPVTPTEQPDEQVPADEDGEVGTGAKMDPHGDEPESDPLPEGLEDEEDEA